MSAGGRKAAAPPPPQGGGVTARSAPPSDSITSDPMTSTVDVKDKTSSQPQKNGSGPPSISYSNDTEDDENMNEINEDSVLDLRVVLPSGKSSAMEIDANIPMIDLLVHLAGRAKLNPAGHKLLIISEETGKNIDYKANQTVGSLGIDTIHLVDKKAINEKNKKNVHVHPVTNREQPFEMTYRLTINLPRNQKSVIRINPKVQLHSLFRNVCEDKNLDPSRFTFQHPAKPDHPLDPRMTVGDLNSNEINLVQASMSKAKRSKSFMTPVSDHAQSMPDLRRSESSRVASQAETPPSAYMPGSTSEKKKSRIFSFFKKEKKFKPHAVSITETPSPATPQQRVGGSPQMQRRTEKPRQDRPKTMYAGMSPEENGRLQARSNSNGQLPQGVGATPTVTESQTLQRPPRHKSSPASPQEQDYAAVSHTLPKPAGRSPAKGHGKKRQAPPPPQQTTPPPQQTPPPQTAPSSVTSESHTPPPTHPPSQHSPHASTPQSPETPPPQHENSASVPPTDTPSANSSEDSKTSNLEKLTENSIGSPEAAVEDEGGSVEVSVLRSDSNETPEGTSSGASSVTTGVTASASSEISVSVENGVQKRSEHSRTSSDSSGYHEATLSGPESPEANRLSSMNYKDTSMDSASIESSENVAVDPPAREVSRARHDPPALNIPSLRSQMRNREEVNEPQAEADVLPVEFATMPRKRVDKKKAVVEDKEALKRSHSLEKEAKAAPPHRRKKAPAPPPPPVGASPKDSPRSVRSQTSVDSSPLNPPTANGKEEHPPAANGHRGSIDSLEENPALRGIREQKSDDGHRQSRAQPPLFIPPPPPDTPPPPETPPISDQRVVIDSSTCTEELEHSPANHTQKELDVSSTTERVEPNSSKSSERAELDTSITSEASVSSKNSPPSSQPRCESRTSKSSVTTIEEVNLAFDETIAMGEEVWAQSLEDDGSQRKTGRASDSEPTSPVESPREVFEKSSFQELPDVSSSSQAQISETLTTEQGPELSGVSTETETVFLRTKSNDKSFDSGRKPETDQGVSEITYDFKVDAVPAEFSGGEPSSRQSMSEEEEITFIEEEVVFTAPAELIQIYKDDALVQREREKNLENRSTKSSDVPGATVPDWDTSAQHDEPPNEEVVHAKMVMVEPVTTTHTHIPYNQTVLRSSSQDLPFPSIQVDNKPDTAITTTTAVTASASKSRLKGDNSGVDPADRTEKHSSAILQHYRDEARNKYRRRTEESKKKEEFVFEKTDLKKIDFLGGRKPKKSFSRLSISSSSSDDVRTSPVVFDMPRIPIQTQSPPVASKPSKTFMVPQPYKKRSNFSSETDSTRTSTASPGVLKSSSRSDYNFVPESEAENVLEEKSISLINLPVKRVSSSERPVVSGSYRSGADYVKSASLTSIHGSSLDNQHTVDISSNGEQASHSDRTRDTPAVEIDPANEAVSTEQQNLANVQYDQLQTQFAMWQQQLAQNQQLLAQHQIAPDNQSQQLQQLQMQLQLQQQMMEQLQQSMQALALQGAGTGSGQPPVPAPAPVQATEAKTRFAAPPVAPPPVAPPPPPIAPPSAPPVPQVVKSEPKPSKSKSKKRFERQLDPREELMLAIRQAAGRNCLKKVTVKEARWTNRTVTGE